MLVVDFLKLIRNNTFIKVYEEEKLGEWNASCIYEGSRDDISFGSLERFGFKEVVEIEPFFGSRYDTNEKVESIKIYILKDKEEK